ncbi:MAG TPA: M1 family metallopeptidase [Anaerolineales bacterium]|nr:M1 family metallopeptidase [Anaerolineales bacterium]
MSVKIAPMSQPNPTFSVRLASYFLLLVLLSSCSLQSPTPPFVFTATPPLPATEAPPTSASLPTETSTPVSTAQPALERPQYVLDMQLNYAAKAATVNETITYPNWTGETLNNLVLAVEPNLWSGGFDLNSLAIDGQPVTSYTIENLSQRLEVQLPQPLPPSGTITINASYGLILPQMQAYINASNDVRPQIYGYSDKQVNFVDWYPFVVPYIPGQGWVLHNPWYYGEHLVYDLADFDVTVTFTDRANPLVASSGAEVGTPPPRQATGDPPGTLVPPTSIGIVSRRFVLEQGRTFALSMSDYFKVAKQTVGAVTVYSYYFGLYDAPGQAMLQTTVEALQAYSARFGPYRHKTMTAVQGDFNDGMEYSGLYFISRDYFNLYDGTPKNYLVIIAAHETAHQWWFDAVANDQALEPWLDEALATYSEHVYYETVHPDLVDWWWSYRYFEFDKAGYVDTQIYDGGGQRPYWDKVYLTGARFLEDLRKRVGDDIFFKFLRDYYAQFAGKRATGADFFRVLHENTAADITDLLIKYFKNTY